MTNPSPLDTAREALVRARAHLADWQDREAVFEIDEALAALVPKAKQGGAVSSSDYHQRRGAAWDIIDQAIHTYDEWMLDDDYNAQRILDGVIAKMRERRTLYADPVPSPDQAITYPPEAKQEGGGSHDSNAANSSDGQRIADNKCDLFRTSGHPAVAVARPDPVPSPDQAKVPDEFDLTPAEYQRYKTLMAEPDQATTYPPEMLPVAEDEAEVIVVNNDGSQRKVWPPDQATHSHGDVEAEAERIVAAAERVFKAACVPSQWLGNMDHTAVHEPRLLGGIAAALSDERQRALIAARAESRAEPDWRDAIVEIAREIVVRLDGPPNDINGTPMTRLSQLSSEIGELKAAFGLPTNDSARRAYAARAESRAEVERLTAENDELRAMVEHNAATVGRMLDKDEAAEASARKAGERFDLAAHLCRQKEWSEKTFGPGPRTKGVIDHIRKELNEIEADPLDLMEWVDVVILAFDGAWRAGWEADAIIAAIVAKQATNEARKWPDWRTAPADKAIEHALPLPGDGEAGR